MWVEHVVAAAILHLPSPPIVTTLWAREGASVSFRASASWPDHLLLDHQPERSVSLADFADTKGLRDLDSRFALRFRIGQE